VKRAELIRRIGAAARETGVEWRLIREGRSHELWQCGRINVIIPRHREVAELTALGIMASLQPEFGRTWWRR